MNLELVERLHCPSTGGPLRVEAVDQDGDDLRHGVLHSESGAYAVVAGIPILRRDLQGMDAVIGYLRAGDFGAAARRAAFDDVPPAGLRRLGGWLADTERLRSLGARADARHHRRLDEQARALTDPSSGVRDLFALAYRRIHLRNVEVYGYNWHRFGLPRQLAALAAVEWAPRRGPVLDLACGAGHLTWALRRDLDVPVVGVDGLFFALYVAKTRIAPDAELACVELESLPLPDDSFAGIWASDVLHAISPKLQAWRELERVSRPDAWGAVVWLAVKGTDHHQPGRPLTVDGYRRLLPDDATLVSGDALLEQYLGGHAADRSAPGDLATATTVTALWDRTGEARDGRPFDDWPHARGRLGLNTLLEPVGGDEVRLRMPTEEFAREHRAVARYLPESADLTEDEGRLIEQFVLLGYPDGYLGDG